MEIKVILADDHAVVREGLRLILELKGFIKVVAEAEDGLKAVKLAGEFMPDVIVMDIAMPKMNGIEATRRIIEDNSSIRVIILSMHGNTEDIFRALQAGATGYLLKESAGAEIADAVRAVYCNRRYLSAKVDEIVIDSYISGREPAKRESPLEKLSAREREVLQLVAEGNSSKDISDLLHLSVKTVETYRSRMMQKLGLKDMIGLVRFAIRHGLIR